MWFACHFPMAILPSLVRTKLPPLMVPPVVESKSKLATLIVPNFISIRSPGLNIGILLFLILSSNVQSFVFTSSLAITSEVGSQSEQPSDTLDSNSGAI